MEKKQYRFGSNEYWEDYVKRREKDKITIEKEFTNQIFTDIKLEICKNDRWISIDSNDQYIIFSNKDYKFIIAHPRAYDEILDPIIIEGDLKDLVNNQIKSLNISYINDEVNDESRVKTIFTITTKDKIVKIIITCTDVGNYYPDLKTHLYLILEEGDYNEKYKTTYKEKHNGVLIEIPSYNIFVKRKGDRLDV